MSDLCKKRLSQEWDEPCHQAFGELKRKFFLPHVLKFLDFHKHFKVYMRRGTLPLADVDGRWIAIAFKSMKLDGCSTLSDLLEKWLSQE